MLVDHVSLASSCRGYIEGKKDATKVENVDMTEGKTFKYSCPSDSKRGMSTVREDGRMDLLCSSRVRSRTCSQKARLASSKDDSSPSSTPLGTPSLMIQDTKFCNMKEQDLTHQISSPKTH